MGAAGAGVDRSSGPVRRAGSRALAEPNAGSAPSLRAHDGIQDVSLEYTSCRDGRGGRPARWAAPSLNTHGSLCPFRPILPFQQVPHIAKLIRPMSSRRLQVAATRDGAAFRRRGRTRRWRVTLQLRRCERGRSVHAAFCWAAGYSMSGLTIFDVL